jgi:hypothetical protein
MANPTESANPDTTTTATAADEAPVSPLRRAAKGCGCLGGLGVMAFGILAIGHFDSAAWASALIALIVGVLVFAMSGVNGFWES